MPQCPEKLALDGVMGSHRPTITGAMVTGEVGWILGDDAVTVMPSSKAGPKVTQCKRSNNGEVRGCPGVPARTRAYAGRGQEHRTRGQGPWLQ